MEEFACCICGRTVSGYGNNAQPLADGRCCDRCNVKVIEERLNRLDQEENKSCPVEKK